MEASLAKAAKGQILGGDEALRLLTFLMSQVGQGMENGGWFTKISQESDRSFSYYFTVRKSAVVDP